MNATLRKWIRAPLFSPEGFVVWAAVLSAGFGICHAAGLREYTSAISLTFPEGVTPQTAAALGMAYLVMYFIFVLVVPVLLLGAGVFALLRRMKSSANVRH